MVESEEYMGARRQEICMRMGEVQSAYAALAKV